MEYSYDRMPIPVKIHFTAPEIAKCPFSLRIVKNGFFFFFYVKTLSKWNAFGAEVVKIACFNRFSIAFVRGRKIVSICQNVLKITTLRLNMTMYTRVRQTDKKWFRSDQYCKNWLHLKFFRVLHTFGQTQIASYHKWCTRRKYYRNASLHDAISGALVLLTQSLKRARKTIISIYEWCSTLRPRSAFVSVINFFFFVTLRVDLFI